MPSLKDFIKPESESMEPEKKKPARTKKKTPKKEKTSPIQAADSSKEKTRAGSYPGEKDITKRKPSNSSSFRDKELEELGKKASRAALEEQIYKTELVKFKTEKEKMAIEKEAGILIEFDLANFLFFSYMEKMNLQMLGLMKRNQARLENLIKERDPKGVEKLVNREIKNILIDIKKQQQKDLDEWKRG